MKRNINLLKRESNAAQHPLTARNVALGWGLVALALAALQFGLDRRADTRHRAAEATTLEVAAVEEAITAQAAARIAGPDPQLEARLADVMRELDLRETIVGLLGGAAAGDIDGFSAQLRSLARQNANGVWLTRVEVSAPGAQTTLEGAALAPEFVPVFLRQLSAEPALAGQRFDRFQIERGEAPDDHVSFAMNRVDNGAEEGT